MKTTKLGANTALAQIVKLVQEAQNSKARGSGTRGPGRVLLALVTLIGGAGTLLAGRSP